MAAKEAALAAGRSAEDIAIEPADVFVSLVVPAYNEEERLGIMLTEAAAFLEQQYGATAPATKSTAQSGNKTKSKKRSGEANGTTEVSAPQHHPAAPKGYEILLVSDGSTDRTIETALAFARKHLPPVSRPNLRVITLEKNRGKGGAVTHGLRHARGCYALFADADGATRFSDLGPVLDACRALELSPGTTSDSNVDTTPPGTLPAVSVGSRAHMVNTPAVVKRSALRNFLMRSFHLFLKYMTPRKTAQIGDTQCGFKLFSRGALPHIVPWMHSEGWIFDVEMLMLAESAGIEVAEVPVGWKEIGGSKLNVVWDSLGMAWGLAVLRGAWMMGVYRRL